MYLAIIAVTATNDYQLWLKFENAEQRVFDLKPLLATGRFAELQDLRLFKSVTVSFDTIQWPNGLDLDPEYLYERSVKAADAHSAA